MKRKDWKRTAAFVTSVAMATSMMPVELGGVLVHAIDSAIVSESDGSALTATTLQQGDYFENDAVLNVPDGGKIKVIYTKGAGSAVATATGNSDFEVSNVSKIKFESAHKDNPEDLNSYGLLTVEPKTGDSETIKLDTYNDTHINFIAVKDVTTAANGVTTIELEEKEVVDKYTINYSDARKYINSIKYTSFDDGVANELSGSVVSSTTAIEAKPKTTVTIESRAILNIPAKYMTGEPGKYVYTFNALDDYQDATAIDLASKTIDVGETFIKFDSEGKASADGALTSGIGILEYNGKKVADANKLEDIANLPAGAEVTIVANNMFRIPNGAIKSVKDDHTFEYEDVVSTYSQGKWTATFCLSDFVPSASDYEGSDPEWVKDGKLDLCFIKHDHKLTYNLTNKVNELLATCKDGDLTNEIAAKIWTEIAPAKNGEDPTEIANNGTIHYDDNATLNFTWNKDLLGTSGQNDLQTEDRELQAKAILKKGDDEYTIRVYKENGEKQNTVKITKTYVDDKGQKKTEVINAYTFNENNVITTTVNNYVGGTGGSAVAKVGALGGIVTITPSSIEIDKEYAAKAGTFEAELYVWETNVTAEAKILKYKYQTAPSEQIQESDIKVFAAYTGDLHATLAPYDSSTVNDQTDFNAFMSKLRSITITEYTIADYVKCVEVFKKAWEKGFEGPELLLNSDGLLTGFATSNNKKIDDAYYNKAVGLLHTVIRRSNDRLKATKVNGVWQIPTDATTLKDKHNVTTVFEVQDSKNIAENIANKNADGSYKDGYPKSEIFFQDIDFSLGGSSISNEIDPSEPNVMRVSIVNPNYKDETFSVQWKLVTPSVENRIYFLDAENYIDVAGAKEIAKGTFENTVISLLKGTGDVDLSKAKFWYSVNPPTDNIDIDDRYDGLPNVTNANVTHVNTTPQEVEENGVYQPEYYIYATLGELETATPIHVKVVADDATNKITVKPALSNNVFTYGDAIKTEDISFKKDGNSLSDVSVDAFAFKIYPFNAANGSYSVKPITEDGVYNDPGAEPDANDYVTNINALVPGQYLIKFINAGTNFKNTTAYSVDETEGIEITINKRQLTTDMVGVITKELGSAKSINVTNADVNQAAVGRGSNNKNLDLKITGAGSQNSDTANKIGTYSVQVTASDKSVPAEELVGAQNAKYSDLYEGKININWYVVKNLKDTEIQFVNDDTKANIYKDDKNGVQIHIEAKMQIKNTAGSWVNGTKPTVKYGFVYDKTNKFANDDARATVDEVAKSLRLDTGFSSTNGVLKNTDGVVTGLNSIVKSVDDYIWVRPYAVVDGGAPVYGNPVRYDFQSVAADAVKPEIKRVELVQKKTKKDAESGDVFYYVYATKADRLDTEKNRTAEPDRWGVVISRNGNYTDLKTNDANAKAFDYNNLTLDSCDTHSEAKKSGNYNEYEVGTLVKITDSLSRVYVRTYADYGNGLVVYNDLPTTKKDGTDIAAANYDTKLNEVSCDSASEQLCTILGVTANVETKNDRIRMTVTKSNIVGQTDAAETLVTKTGKEQIFEAFTVNNDPDDSANSANWITETGLIIDKNGLYNPLTKNIKLVLGEGIKPYNKTGAFIADKGDTVTKPDGTGAGANDDNNKYTDFSAITSAAKVNFRGYVVYKGITVYTDIVTYPNT